MLIVFCRDPLEPARPDRAFGAEVAAVERLGLPYVLVDQDALVRGDEPDRIVRRMPAHPESRLAAYRGWMVTPSQYRALYQALTDKGTRGVSSNGTEEWGKIVIRRVFPGLRGRNRAVLPRVSPELDV